MRLIDADVLKQHIDKLPALPDGNFAGNHSALKALINMQPTIESSTNNSEIPNSSDCISRQQAIDGKIVIQRANGVEIYSDEAVPVEYLKSLPPAQPDLDEWCTDCREYDKDRHSCPRWNRVIRQTVEDMKAAQPEPAIPLSWIEGQIEQLNNTDNYFAELTANIIKTMLNEWRKGEQK